jgi:hypothetical protein
MGGILVVDLGLESRYYHFEIKLMAFSKDERNIKFLQV